MTSLQGSCGIHDPFTVSPKSADDFVSLLARLKAVSATALRLESATGCGSVAFIEKWSIEGVDVHDIAFLATSLPDFEKVTFRITFGRGIPERLRSDDARTLIERAFAVSVLGRSGLMVYDLAELGPEGEVPSPDVHVH